MMELLQRYYGAGRQMALGIGIALSLLSLILLRSSAIASLARGMAYVLVIAGIFQATAGFGYTAIVTSRAADAVRMYSGYMEGDIKQQETTRMQKVLKSSFTGGFVTYTSLLLCGVILVFASHGAPTWKGVALALMIVGVLGHSIEAFSMQANHHYLDAVEARHVT